MNNLYEVFDVPPESWINCLPIYQQNIINDLYQQTNNFDKTAEAWLSASVPENVPFGTTKNSKLFLEKVADEIELFFTNDEKYKNCKLAILKESGAVQSFVIGAISAALAPALGKSAVFLAPVIAIIFTTITQIGLNAWLSYRAELHTKNNSTSKSDI